ncbi:hypothetical protein UlMin_028364 [Ulmus minor]
MKRSKERKNTLENYMLKEKLMNSTDILQQIPIQPDLLKPLTICQYCNAKKFYHEPKGFCCLDGQILLTISNVPQELYDLYTYKTNESLHFHKYIRSYNNNFAFTSFDVKTDKDLCKKYKGVYTFHVQGQIYHYINELVPMDNKPSYLQLYLYDTEHELQNRLNIYSDLNPTIINKLIEILKSNPYCTFFRYLKDIPNLKDHQIVIKSNPDLDQKIYNTPLASQVAAIWLDDNSMSEYTTRDIIVYSYIGFKHKVEYYFGCYDPLQCPLLFPFGEPGWHQCILKVNKTQKLLFCEGQDIVNPQKIHSATELLENETKVLQMKRKRNMVSCREYYCYKLQIRSIYKSILLLSGRLLQQYVVDIYVKLETQRLDYLRNNQAEIRAELYQGIIDSIHIGENQGSKVGKRIILPATFIGSPRDMRKRYMDAMALVQVFGKPDIFLTITCNPNWSEIKEELEPYEEPQNRPDLVARIFRAKLEELKDEIFKKQIFGPVAAYVYVIEFQKRGLPHAHFLIILKSNSKIIAPETFDRFVSAEIPNINQYPYLHSTVIKHMMHGPFKVRGHYLDNQWVVPYNPYLLAKFNCHINVEICSTVKAVKYLYKYIYKGHDRIAFHINSNNSEKDIDEIQNFQSAIWISPPEGVWRIYSFILNENHPSVYTLQLHLENQQLITFKKTDKLDRIIDNDFASKSMLTEYFNMNKTNEKAKTLLYNQFPEHFVWNQRDKFWIPRKKGHVIGRIVTTNPIEGERYYLRLLLNHIRGATCFKDLRIVNNVLTSSFRESVLLRGLLKSDNNLTTCLEEACLYEMPYTLRRLFVTILAFCEPNDPKKLWEKFHIPMSEDYAQLNISPFHVTNKALQHLASMLVSMGKKYKSISFSEL